MIEYAHDADADAWLTVNGWPAMVSVPTRAAPVFAATLNATDPSPLPLVPDVMVIQDSLVVAVQAQPLADETATGLPAPAEAATDSLVGAIEYAHAAPVPAA